MEEEQIDKIFADHSIDEIEEIIVKLKKAGLSQAKTAIAIARKLKIDLGDANDYVLYSTAWKDNLEYNLALNKHFWESMDLQNEDVGLKCICPCCENRTLLRTTPDMSEICPVCAWKDDSAQFKNPDYTNGPNGVSLNQARKNYEKFGAKSLEALKTVRKPLPDEIPMEFEITFYPD